MIFRMQYSERIPYGPTSRRFMISVVVMSVSVVSGGRAVRRTHNKTQEMLHCSDRKNPIQGFEWTPLMFLA